jgi:tetratricopeptide (TPR) repeat protein
MTTRNIFLLCSILSFLTACNSQDAESNHPAYHNPVVAPYTDSIALRKDYAPYYMYRAEALSKIQCDSLAIIDVKQAISLDPSNADYLYTLGYLQWHNNDAATAKLTLEQALKVQPGDVAVRLLLAKVYLELKNSTAAQNQVEKILSADAQHTSALLLSAAIKMNNADTLGAISILEQVSHSLPLDYQASYQLADGYASTHNDRAITQYWNTYQLDTLDANPIYDLALYYQSKKQHELAQQSFVKCITIDRDFTPAYIALGKEYMNANQDDKALRHFNLAIGTEPNSSESYYNKGLCFLKLNIRDSAVRSFQQALVYDRNHKEAAAALAKLQK